ncbi:MAG: FemAB family XrtA/PEP-CTERM system-associated protein, partial [Caldimonas sp.]
MLQVARLLADDSSGAARWDSFVQACPAATFFHRAGWQAILRDVFRHETHYLYAETDGRIEGVLPLARVKSLLFGHALVSLPFAVYGGVAATSDAAADALEQEAQRLAQQLGVEHLELRNVIARHADWPMQDLYVTFRKPLLADDAANMQAIPRKQRAMVRKGIKNALVSEVDSGVERFFALYADNVHRHGTPALPKRYFEALRSVFGADCEVLTVAGTDGRPLSSVMSFYFRDEVLPYYAGDDEAARDLAANDFKYWELMRHAAARG